MPVATKTGFAGPSRETRMNSYSLLRLSQRSVSDRGDFFAAGIRDLARLFIEEAGRLQTIGHFSQRNDRLNANGQVDVGIGLLSGTDAIKPVLFVDPDVLRL